MIKISELDKRIKGTVAYDNYINEAREDVETTKERVKETFGDDAAVYETQSQEEAAELIEVNLRERRAKVALEMEQSKEENGYHHTETKKLRNELTRIGRQITQISSLNSDLKGDKRLQDINTEISKLGETKKSQKENKEKIQQLRNERESILQQEGQTTDGFFSNGFMLTEVDGTTKIIINTKASLKNGYTTTGQHEFLHAVLKNTIKGDPTLQMAIGGALNQVIAENPNIKGGKELTRRLSVYQGAEAYEELLPLLSEALSRKDIKISNNLLSNVANGIQSFFRENNKNITFDSGGDVLNFIKNYNKTFFYNFQIR